MIVADNIRQHVVQVDRSPQLKLTKYDLTVSVLATAATVAVSLLSLMVLIFLSSSAPARDLPPDTISTIIRTPDCGASDVDSNQTPFVDSPEDPTNDSSLANEEKNVTVLDEAVEQAVDESSILAEAVAATEIPGLMLTIVAGSADGTGTKPLGLGNTDGRGTSNLERRWHVEFSSPGDLKSYGVQLDSLGIELGAMFATEGRLVYMCNMSADTPTTREISEREADSEQRLFMNWVEGSIDRRKADVELFHFANIDATDATVLHFYSKETEQKMATMEKEYGGRSIDEIRRTHFRVRKSDNGYEFYVFRQLLR